MRPTQLMSNVLNIIQRWGQKLPPPTTPTDITREEAMAALGIDHRTLGAARIISKGHSSAISWAQKLLGTNQKELEEFQVWQRMPIIEKAEKLLQIPKSLTEFAIQIFHTYSDHKKADHGAWKFETSKKHLVAAMNSITNNIAKKSADLGNKEELSDQDAKELTKLYAEVVVRLYFALFVSLHGTKQKAKPDKVKGIEFEINK
jgi:hypothetical protein